MHNNDIIDNRRQKLVDYIVKLLTKSDRAHFAVGYLYLSGLEPLRESLENVKELRLLIGNTSNRDTIEQIAEGYRHLQAVANAHEQIRYAPRSEKKQWITDSAVNLKESIGLMEQTEEAEKLIDVLIKMITEKRLKVRIFTKGRLHAKAYIFDYANPTPSDKGIAIVGSSNLTLSGITDNTELNVLVHDNASPIIENSGNHGALVEWFNELWNEAENFDEYLMTELSESWAVKEVTPYDIYMKTLYTLVKDRLEDDSKGIIGWDDKIFDRLADFQKNAVGAAINYINKFNGCFISDVVGLGKSYIGAAVLKHYSRVEGSKSLIICPKSLEEMWIKYNEVFDLNAKVVSMSMLMEDEEQGVNLDDEVYEERNFVLIDESHHFRNTGTQKYKVLQDYLWKGKKVCLLTATPYNRDAKDVYNQIKLFHPEDKTSSFSIDPPDLKEYFGMVYRGERPLKELLQQVLIRRTRKDILKYYGYTGDTGKKLINLYEQERKPYLNNEKKAYVIVNNKKTFFPKRELDSLRYNIEQSYNGLYQELRGYLGKSGGKKPKLQPGVNLTFARYGLWNYVKSRKKNVSPYSELQRAGINLRGLMRISHFKRLESSVYAYQQTISRSITINENFLKSLNDGIIPAGEKAQKILYESDNNNDKKLIDALSAVSGDYNINDFNIKKLKHHIESDLKLLKEMLKIIGKVKPENDAKLQTLLSNLKKSPLNDGKVLIFTQYADTAKYIFENLGQIERQDNIEVIFSGEKNKQKVVARFAPKANPEDWKRYKSSGEVSLLVATDVLSEGLNLQDCDKIINYDLHWNPVRLIQRFGRIDRIGSEFDKIYAYNFLPETNLEKELGITELLRQRIKEIHETIGEDSAVLDPSERLNEDAMYAIYEKGKDGEQLSVFEDDSGFMDLNEAEEHFRKMKKDNPVEFERIINLRDGIRCGKNSLETHHYIYNKSGNFHSLYLTDHQGKIISKDLQNILMKICSLPEEPSIRITANHKSIVIKSKKLFENENEYRNTQLKHISRLSAEQQYINKELRKYIEEIYDEDKKHQVLILLEAFIKVKLGKAVTSRIRNIKRNKLEGEILFQQLSDIYFDYGLKKDVDKREHEMLFEAVPKIICSMELRG